MMKRFSRLTRRAKLAVVAGSVVPLVLVATAGATHLGSLLLGHVNTANERTGGNCRGRS